MGIFIYVVKKWKGGGKDENMDGGKQTQQPNPFALLRFRKSSGGIGTLMRSHASKIALHSK